MVTSHVHSWIIRKSKERERGELIIHGPKTKIGERCCCCMTHKSRKGPNATLLIQIQHQPSFAEKSLKISNIFSVSIIMATNVEKSFLNTYFAVYFIKWLISSKIRGAEIGLQEIVQKIFEGCPYQHKYCSTLHEIKIFIIFQKIRFSPS